VGPVRVLGDIDAHLAMANVPGAQDTWAVLSSQTVSLQTFALYGRDCKLVCVRGQNKI
jgi:hypothetical protein